MKQNLKKFKIFGLLLAVLLCAGLFAGCNKQEEVVVLPDDEEAAVGIQLLSFESYEELTGTKIKGTNGLGNITINKDTAYITEGEGSMLVEPEGDYNTGDAPTLQFDCLYTTFATSDFSDIQYVSMDVYNATDEELSITVYFTVANYSGTFVETTRVTFTLAANAWTECVYEVDENILSSYFDLTEVRYMTILFNQHKESKDDTPNAIYFDNLYGTYYTETPETVDYEYSFYEGVGLEEKADLYLFTNQTVEHNVMNLQRVSYDSLSIEALEGGGEYCMMTDVTGEYWPSFTINYGESVPANTVLTFWIYFEVEEEDGDIYRLSCYTSSDSSSRTTHTISGMNSQFNCWYQVQIMLNATADSSYVAFNLDDFLTPTVSDCIFGDRTVTIYMDNFQLEYIGETVTEENGVYTITNPLGATYISCDIDMPVKAGQIISFDVELSEVHNFAVWVLGDGSWTYEYFAKSVTGTNKYTVTLTAPADMDYFTVGIQYRDENEQKDTTSDLTGIVATISNISVTTPDPDVTVLADGSLVLANPNYKGQVSYTFDYDVITNTKISFNVTNNSDAENYAVWIQGISNDTGVEVFARGYLTEETGNECSVSYTFSFPYTTTDSNGNTITIESFDQIKIIVAFRNADGSWDTDGVYAKGTATISNLVVEQLVDDVTELEDGSLLLSNPNYKGQVSYTFDYDVITNTKVSFTVTNNSDAENYAIWIQGISDGTGVEVFAKGYETADTDNVSDVSYTFSFPYTTTDSDGNTVTIESFDQIKIIVAFRNADGSFDYDGVYADGTATISNLVVEQLIDDVTELEDGSLLLSNPNYKGQVSYTFDYDVVGNTTISFTVTNNSDAENYAVWIQGISEGTGVEVYAAGFETASTDNVSNISYSFSFPYTTTDSTGSTVTIESFDQIKIIVAFRNADGSFDYDGVYADGTATISNLVVETKKDDVAVVTDDGATITLYNYDGNAYVNYSIVDEFAVGDTLSFTLTLNESCSYALWVLEDGQWGSPYEIYAAGLSGDTVTVSVEVNTACDLLQLYIQYRGDYTSLEEMVATFTNVTVTHKVDDVTVLEDGTIILANPNSSSRMTYTITDTIVEGTTVEFTVSTNGICQAAAVWICGYVDGSYVSPEPYAKGFSADETGIATNSVSWTADQDYDYIYLLVENRTSGGSKYLESDYTDCTFTITGLTITQPVSEITVSDDGSTVVITNAAGATSKTYDVEGSFVAGDSISFDIEITNIPDDFRFAVWVLEDGEWGTHEIYANGSSGSTKSVTATVAADCEYLQIYIQYRNSSGSVYSGDTSAFVATITNLTITRVEVEVPEVSVAEDGTITVTNAANDTNKCYDIEQDLAAGSEISFTITLTGLDSETWALWVLEDGDWGEAHCLFVEGISGTTTKTVSVTTANDCSYVEIFWQYRTSSDSPDTTTDKTGVVATITDLTVVPYEAEVTVAEDGTITVTNAANDTNKSYTVEQEFSAGDVISFTISLTGLDSNAWAVWVLEDGSWDDGHEIYANGISGSLSQDVQVTICSDCSYVVIFWQYRLAGGSPDTTTDKTGVVATISNLTLPSSDIVLTGFTTDGGNRRSTTIEESVVSGTNLSFTFSLDLGTSEEEDPYYAIWVYGYDDDSDSWVQLKVYGAYEWTSKGEYTVDYTYTGTYSAIKVTIGLRGVSYRNQTDYYTDFSDATVTLKDVTITQP